MPKNLVVRSQEDLKRVLSQALTLEVPYRHNLPVTQSQAGVLILVSYPGLEVLLTKRTDTVESHKGQIAFPGGIMDPEDSDLIATALRETREEMGIDPHLVEVVGTMPKLCTITGFDVTPTIGILKTETPKSHQDLVLNPNPGEIDDYFWVPLPTLAEIHQVEWVERGALRFETDVFYVSGSRQKERVWGITAMILKNLIDRIAGRNAS